MQTVTTEGTKISDTSFAKGFGEYDLWELWLLDEAEDVPCGSILTFLHYLCSEGTKHCEILDANTFALTKNRLTPNFETAEQVSGLVTRAVADS